MNPDSGLRPYQIVGLNMVRAAMSRGHRRVLLVGPAGMGKTTIFCAIVRGSVAKERHVLIVVHRRELVEQAVRRLRREGVDDIGLILSGEDSNPAARVQVASIQTLLARGIVPPAGLIIFDEAHHYVADEWKALAEHYPLAHVVGVTATPERGDGTGLGDGFDAMCVVASVKELTELGYLTSELARGSYRSKNAAEQSTDLSSFKESGGIEYGVAVAMVLRSVEGKGDAVDVTVPKNRLGKKDAFRLALDPRTCRFTESDAAEASPNETAKFNSLKAAVLRVAGERADLNSKRAMQRAIRDIGLKARNGDVDEAVGELVANGLLATINGCFRPVVRES